MKRVSIILKYVVSISKLKTSLKFTRGCACCSMSSLRQLLGSGCGFSHYVAPLAVMFQDGRVPLILSVVSNHSNPFLTFQVLSLAQLDCVQPNYTNSSPTITYPN